MPLSKKTIEIFEGKKRFSNSSTNNIKRINSNIKLIDLQNSDKNLITYETSNNPFCATAQNVSKREAREKPMRVKSAD